MLDVRLYDQTISVKRKLQPAVTDRFLTFITQGEELDLVGKLRELCKTNKSFHDGDFRF
jgi:hypothetical protein